VKNSITKEKDQRIPSQSFRSENYSLLLTIIRRKPTLQAGQADLVGQRSVRILVATCDAVLIADSMHFLHQSDNRIKLLVSVADPRLELIVARYQLLQRYKQLLCR